jgi:signal transduction histidine kinase
LRWAGALLVAGLLATSGRPAAAAGAKNVLVLYSNNRLTRANVEMERGLHSAIPITTAHPVNWFDEFLDRPRFGGEAHERTMVTYLRDKYAAQPPDLIVSLGDEALDFLVRHRGELLPGVPVIFAAVDRATLGSMPPLPAHMVGIVVDFAFAATIDQALLWHPQAQRLVIVTGTSERDRQWEARLRAESPRWKDRVTVEFLAGLPTTRVLKRLSELGNHAVVFTPGYFQGGEGRSRMLDESVETMAAISTAPVYGPFDTFMGSGVVGGHMADFEALGFQAGRLVSDLVAGSPPEALQLPEPASSPLQVDWRQVRRWGIDPKAIPAGAIVHFQPPPSGKTNWTAVLIIAVVSLLQAGLIVWLLIEYRRRHLAEISNQVQRTEFAHASRLAVAGELTASIAHEINQPLGAIMSNADAAEMILGTATNRRTELGAILGDIRRDSERASQVIRRLRELLARQKVEQRPFEINDAVRDVETMLHHEANRRRMTLDTRPAAIPLSIVGDRVQIQQVLMNLVLNAMDVMADVPEHRRTVVVSVERVARGIAIAVRDRGKGIAPGDIPNLFKSFYSTKRGGMGLGLAIARSIVEAHGGRIWAENGRSEGAVFHVELPLAGLPTPSPTHAMLR